LVYSILVKHKNKDVTALHNYSLRRRSIQEYINLREAYGPRAEKKDID
jgi:type IV secretory pathway component VirB8